jgi:hypothetical protein
LWLFCRHNPIQEAQLPQEIIQCNFSILVLSYLLLSVFAPNEPVEKVTFLKTASSAGSKIGNDHFFSSRVFGSGNGVFW